MEKISTLFNLEVAKSKGSDDYEPGLIPFVTSAEVNNGVVCYVNPDIGDKVFKGPALFISGLGHCSVQLNDFLPKGNGGDSLTILTPKQEMTVEDLLSFAAVFNSQHKWRFSFGRKCSISRLENLEVDFPFPQQNDMWSNEINNLKSITENISENLKKVVDVYKTDDSL